MSRDTPSQVLLEAGGVAVGRAIRRAWNAGRNFPVVLARSLSAGAVPNR